MYKVITPDATATFIKQGGSLSAQMDAVLTGSIDRVGSDDDSQTSEHTRQDGTKYTTTTWTRTAQLQCTLTLEHATDRSVINTKQFTETTSASADTRSGLPTVEAMISGIISNANTTVTARPLFGIGGSGMPISEGLLASLPRLIAPWKQQVKLKFEKVKSDDDAVQDQADEANQAAKDGVMKQAQKIWSDIYAKHQIKEAGYNAALALQVMGKIQDAIAAMQKVVNDTGWQEAQDQLAKMQARLGANKTVAEKYSGNTQSTVDKAIADAYADLKANIPANSNIAFFNVSKQNKDTVNHCIDEISKQLVNNDHMTVVDRSNAKLVAQEQNFQASGAVSDDSAVELGKELGASVIVVSSVTGEANTSTLTFKILDIETAKILHITSLPF
jgi:hypothetical protein